MSHHIPSPHPIVTAVSFGCSLVAIAVVVVGLISTVDDRDDLIFEVEPAVWAIGASAAAALALWFSALGSDVMQKKRTTLIWSGVNVAAFVIMVILAVVGGPEVAGADSTSRHAGPDTRLWAAATVIGFGSIASGLLLGMLTLIWNRRQRSYAVTGSAYLLVGVPVVSLIEILIISALLAR